jgi:hypothetical protein
MAEHRWRPDYLRYRANWIRSVLLQSLLSGRANGPPGGGRGRRCSPLRCIQDVLRQCLRRCCPDRIRSLFAKGRPSWPKFTCGTVKRRFMIAPAPPSRRLSRSILLKEPNLAPHRLRSPDGVPLVELSFPKAAAPLPESRTCGSGLEICRRFALCLNGTIVSQALRAARRDGDPECITKVMADMRDVRDQITFYCTP